MERTRVIRRRSIRRFASYSVVVALISTAFLTLSTNALGGTQLTRPNIILILSDYQSYESSTRCAGEPVGTPSMGVPVPTPSTAETLWTP